MAKTERNQSRSMARDERGAIMVIAVFFAVFLVALLFSLVGTAQAIFIREHLQDSVDGAVLSAAVLDAQAMNLIVLANIVMAALLAILVALKAIEALCLLAIAICMALAYFTGGSTLAAIPGLNAVRSTTVSIHDSLKEPIFKALETLHDVSGAIASSAPALAKAGAQARLTTAGTYPAENGAIYGKAVSLPVEDDEYKVLCARSGGVVCDVVLLPFGSSAATGIISSACEGVAGAFSTWFCDDKQGGLVVSAPDQKDNVLYPQTTQTRRCSGEGNDGENDDAEVDEACSWVRDAESDKSGNCTLEERCDDQGNHCRAAKNCDPYEAFVEAARAQCDPALGAGFEHYSYQLHEAKVVYTFKKGKWSRGTPTRGTYSRVLGQKKPPCTADGKHASIGAGYVVAVHPNSDRRVVNPVCSDEKVPEVTADLEENATVTVRIKEVTQILGCTKTEKVEVPIDKDADQGSKEERSPKKITEGTKLGAEPFRLRAMGERSPKDGVGKLVKLALWGQKENSGFTRMKWLTSLSYAESEYFYNGKEKEDSWMWNMKWKARMRRFSAPADLEDVDAVVAFCADVDFDHCSRLMGEIVYTGLSGH